MNARVCPRLTCTRLDLARPRLPTPYLHASFIGFVSVRTIKGRSIFTVIARVCTRLACTRRHRDRPCLHTPCLHTSSPSTSCMHPHKSAPIDALPRRVPRPWNCHPSVVEVILHRPQEPRPPKPLAPLARVLWLRLAHAAAQLRLPGRPRPPSCAPAPASTSAMEPGEETQRVRRST